MPYGELLCTKCNISKPESEFYSEPRNTKRNGKRTQCKACDYLKNVNYRNKPGAKEKQAETRRIWSRLNRYNFTPGMYEERLKEQGNTCAICKTDTPGGRGQFHADHNHKTETPRGVLCHNCNVALGNFKDNPEFLQRAIEYLNKYSEVK
jgi:hypothetical protein